MKNNICVILVLLATIMLLHNCSNKINKHSKANNADQYIKDIQNILQNDSIKNIWGIDLYGPMMFINPDSRKVYANKQDKYYSFVKEKDLYTGYLPFEYNIANTSFVYADEVWTSVVLTKNASPVDRNRLVVHELWHSKQNELGIYPCMSKNYHLDDIEGCVLLKLEILSLYAALLETNKNNVKNHLENALFIRDKRQTIYPDNNENVFECHEGLAEYTAVKSMLYLYGNEYKNTFLEKMLSILNEKSLSNSFAYTTGPAYGLILDEIYPSWRELVVSGQTLTDVVRTYLNRIPDSIINNNEKNIENIINLYDANELVVQWRNEKQDMINKANKMKDKFINNDLLYISNNNISFSFNPQEGIVQYGDSAVIYKTMRLSGDFGIIDVFDGVMVSNNWKYFIIPYGHSDKTKSYTLDLTNGYQVIRIDNNKFRVAK